MKLYFQIWIICGLAVCLNVQSGIAQSEFKSEAELIKAAEKLFNSKDYQAALPLYSQIVSNRPDNAKYNYGYGVCQVEAGAEKDEAVSYLKLASTSPQISQDVWLYLARALHAGGFFEEALVAIADYRNVSGKSAYMQSIATELEANCNTAISMRSLKGTTEYRIVESINVTLENFHQFYSFEQPVGRFLKVPKEYQSKWTSGSDEAMYLFVSDGGEYMVLSRDDMKKGTGFDVHLGKRDITGKFSDLKVIPAPLNTPGFNEAFATVTNNGNTIYFSRKGEGSMGGYDIFRSDFSTETGLWSAPENAGKPVNSTADDIFFIPSVDGRECYFTSNRNTSKGIFQVHRALIHDMSGRVTVVNGKLNCSYCPSNMKVKVSIVAAESGIEVEELDINPETPEYNVRLESPSSYIYTVSVPGFPVFTDHVTYEHTGDEPGSSQEIIITRTEEGEESMEVITLYNQHTRPESMVAVDQADQNSNSHLKSDAPSGTDLNEIIESEESSTALNQESASETSDGIVTDTGVENTTELASAQVQEDIVENPETSTTQKQSESSTEIQETDPESNIVAENTDQQEQPEPVAEQIPASENGSTNNTENEPVADTGSDFEPVVVDNNTPEQSSENNIHEVSGSVITQSVVTETVETNTTDTRNSEVVAVAEGDAETQNEELSNSTEDSEAEVPANEPVVDNEDLSSSNPVELSTDEMIIHENNDEVATVTGQDNDAKPASDSGTESSATDISDDAPVTAVEFRIQLGAFGKKTPEELTSHFSAMGIEAEPVVSAEKNVVRVYSGSYESYETAIKAKAKVKENGVADAFIVAFSNGQRISLEEVVTIAENQ